MKIKYFTPSFQRELRDAVRTYIDGNEDPLSDLLVKVYQDAYQEGYLCNCQSSSELDMDSAGQAIRNFLDEKLPELEENKKSMIFTDHLHRKYAEYCKRNSIINCLEDKRYKFGECVKAIIGTGYNGWEYDDDMQSIDRQHRGALVYRTRESASEKAKLCEPDKNKFLKYYTKEYLKKLKGSLDSYTKDDLENMLIDYINQKIDLRIKVGAGKRLGRPWKPIKRLEAFQVEMIRQSLQLIV